MNILFVAKHYFGNPDLVRLSSELAKRGHSIRVATSFREVDKTPQNGDIEISEIKPLMTINSLPYSFTFPFSKIHKIAKEQDTEVVHALHDYSTNTAAAAAFAWVHEIPFVYTIQGIGAKTGHLIADALIDIYDRTVETAIASKSRRVVLLSARLMSRARELGVKESNVVVVPSGVDSEHFNPDRAEAKRKAQMLRNQLNIDDKIVIGYVGRLIPKKGLTYLFSAAKRIQDKHSNIVLLVIGDGPQRQELEAMARDFGLETIFTGWQSDVLPYYALMDMFVLPSFFEGLPNVVLEAMAMRKAIIATTVGGNPDLVLNRQNGFLVPPGDVEALKIGIETLASDTDLRLKMGRESRAIAKRSFDWNIIVPKAEKVYEGISS